MPWTETGLLEERLQFVRDALSDRFTLSKRCARYGVSRRIGEKRLARYEAQGRPGLQDRNRAPHQYPHRISKAVEDLLLKERRARPRGRSRVRDPLRALLRRRSRRAGVAQCTREEHRSDLLVQLGCRRRRTATRPNKPAAKSIIEPGSGTAVAR
jgi:putative transposase